MLEVNIWIGGRTTIKGLNQVTLVANCAIKTQAEAMAGIVTGGLFVLRL